ncbi:exodeoxyribonuclease VII large subunit [Leuconostoc lactis]|uniref:Exodeoxyribonuclease 7 large subunit n=1 Tax=Leuconostoc lactis TaxID=1246 RepID=A0A5B8T521_LEULA|nr:exodeoxyribonuclease VII large subunit [Leuconostoc lactis]MCC2743856.1 exodeoxyribonuclease VII large subunit [Leuconostoc lactis]MCC2754818.1 exodeoxyribonuclease VII large subunit [Leuconostoc lactis]MDI6495222.1 exodeoxyribonuclease VII large subunit [Leuconostoc lactis]MWN20774.1 exodeoxyribonuclease VII large subunit [Leuconostoc lactis]PAV32123.1 exodeoxyribonuclease VII large subunit [Leuconostoc lactis]
MSESEKYLTIRALTAYLKRKFDADPYLEKVYVTGEISNLGRRRGRHLYFSIKDPEGQAVISAAMFSYANRLKFVPEEGMKVNAVGRIQVYEPSGTYSIILEQMTPDGIGELFLAYEQLKKKLAAEGLFQLPKRPLPVFPKKIAVVTSPTGAVIEDIARTVQRRFPMAQVVLFPALVQGDKAAASVVKQIKRIDASGEYDTLIVGRGGGAIEDLWAFNDETLARTIAAAKIPIISSVGHETDNTLADLVADHRAATPTAAAELATPVTLAQLVARLNELQLRLTVRMKALITSRQQRLARVAQRPIFQQPDRLYVGYNQRVDQLSQRLSQQMQQRLVTAQHQLDNLTQRQRQLRQTLLQAPREKVQLLTAKLDLMSPLKILTRGYVVLSKADQVVRHVDELQPEDKVTVRLADGQATAKIIETSQLK